MSPNDGGCWYCHGSGGDRFSFEFDTYLHLECLRNALKTPLKNDRETQIIAEEFREELVDAPEHSEAESESDHERPDPDFQVG